MWLDDTENRANTSAIFHHTTVPALRQHHPLHLAFHGLQKACLKLAVSPINTNSNTIGVTQLNLTGFLTRIKSDSAAELTNPQKEADEDFLPWFQKEAVTYCL